MTSRSSDGEPKVVDTTYRQHDPWSKYNRVDHEQHQYVEGTRVGLRTSLKM